MVFQEKTLKRKRVTRRKTPTILQMEAVECGAAALAIVLAYYKKYVPLEELRLACGISRDGSKASNVMRAARRYGLVAKGYKREFVEQLGELNLPIIVFWNFNHFLVVEGFGRDKVYLNDPAVGPRTVSYDEFEAAYTGVVLTFEPGPEFVADGEKHSIVKALQRRLSGSRAALIYVVLVGLLLVVPGLLIPVFSQVFVDYYLLRRLDDWLRPLLFGMAATAVLRAVFTWIQQYYLLRLETKIATSSSSKFLWHVLRLPIEFFTQRYGGEISARVAINDRVAAILSGQLATTVINVFMIVFYGLMMFQYNANLTVIGILLVVANISLLKFISRQRQDTSRRLAMEGGKILGVEMAGLQNIETLKAMGNESDFFIKWSGHQAKMINAAQELGGVNLIFSSIPPALEMVAAAAILALGGWQVIQGNMTIGMLIAFQSLMVSFIGPVGQLVNLAGTVQELDGDLNRLDDVLKYNVDPRLDSVTPEGQLTPLSQMRLTGSLMMNNVSFGYSPLETPLIENFNLNIEPGKRIALVGPSGCGKSTIAKLVCGLYQPWSGEILFDGRPRSEYSPTHFSQSFGFVDQDIFQFEGTVRENLTLWDHTIPDADIVFAARDAAIHEDIAARAGGYDSSVQEGGINFSGGQRQRLEIARSLVLKPSLVVLDEATSALDPQTEMLIDQNLRRRGCACLIIAHRLSTIRDCDEIIVLDHGKVVQRGTHEELIKAPGHYVNLVSAE